MKGLIIKDLMLIKHNLYKGKIIFFLIAYILLTATVFNDLFLLLNIMLLFMLINSISYTFINEEESGLLEFLSVTTNISFSKMVLSRYLSFLLLSAFFTAVFSLIFGIYNIIYDTYTLKEFLIVIIVLLIASLIYVILSTPFLYMFLQNGFVILAVSMSIIIVVTTRFNIFNNDIINQTINLNRATLFLYGIIIISTLFIISCWISTVILKAKVKEE